MPDEAAPTPQKTPFNTFFQEQRKGAVHAEATEGLADLVAACKAHGKKGTMKIEITVDPAKDGQMMAVTTEVTVKEPTPPIPAAMFFASDAGGLFKQHPGQMQIMQAVPSGDEAETPEAQSGGAA